MQARELVETLGANEVVASLEGWVTKEREATAMVVAHLAVMEREGVHLDLGYASLFSYCVERMGYSRDAAFKRIRAARAALVRPEVLDDLESGALTLSGLLVLAPHLDDSDLGAKLLDEARGKTRRQIEAQLAARLLDHDSPRGEYRVTPVGDGLVKIEMVVSTELAEKLERARDVDRHRNPRGDVEPIVDEALDSFIANAGKRRRQNIPQKVRRQVAQRDEGRCTFEGTDKVCGERAFVEVDHIEPKARGGSDSVDNLQLLCSAHNRRKAERQMGSAAARGRQRAQTERELLMAMVGLGFPRGEARERADRALQTHGRDADLETLCRAALAS